VEQVAEQEPAQGEGQRGGEQKRQQGRLGNEREAPESAVTGQHQKLAVGEVQHACHAVLQIEADRDQRINAADHQTCQQEIEQEH
jgi:hypothetical protein